MKFFRKNGKYDWLTIIPVLFWIGCMALSIGKMVQMGKKIRCIDCLDIFNSNTFSTYLSMIICMSYQFFSLENTRKQEISGLSRKWISLTILATIVYGIIAIINACRYNLVTTIIMTVFSVIYIVRYFGLMRSK